MTGWFKKLGVLAIVPACLLTGCATSRTSQDGPVKRWWDDMTYRVKSIGQSSGDRSRRPSERTDFPDVPGLVGPTNRVSNDDRFDDRARGTARLDDERPRLRLDRDERDDPLVGRRSGERTSPGDLGRRDSRDSDRGSSLSAASSNERLRNDGDYKMSSRLRDSSGPSVASGDVRKLRNRLEDLGAQNIRFESDLDNREIIRLSCEVPYPDNSLNARLFEAEGRDQVRVTEKTIESIESWLREKGKRP